MPYSTVQFWGQLGAHFAGNDPDYFEEHDDARRHATLSNPEDNSWTLYGISWSRTTAPDFPPKRLSLFGLLKERL